MDVNEIIVNTWLNFVKKQFTIPSVDYGKYHNDIDLLSVNLLTKEIWDCEIKLRTSSTKISDNDSKQSGFNHFVNSFNDKNRKKTATDYFSKDFDNYKYKRIFITTRNFLGSVTNQKKWVNKFQKADIVIIFFDTIVDDLIGYSKSIKKSNNQVLQILRLSNLYKSNNDKE
jgi:hypothetical protein